jgi:sulfur carrier protein ThiS
VDDEVLEIGGEAVTAQDIVNEIVRRHGKQLVGDLTLGDGSLPPNVILNVNRELIRGSEIKSKIVGGNSEVEILVMPAIAGGSQAFAHV